MTPSTTIDLLYLDAGGGPIRLHALDVRLHLRWPGPNEMPCNAALVRGQELGWFEHGSTILVFAPPGFALAPGARLRMGQALLRRHSGRA